MDDRRCDMSVVVHASRQVCSRPHCSGLQVQLLLVCRMRSRSVKTRRCHYKTQVRDCFPRNDRFLHVDETFHPKMIGEQQRCFCRSDAMISGWSEDQINCLTVNVCWSVGMLNDIE